MDQCHQDLNQISRARILDGIAPVDRDASRNDIPSLTRGMQLTERGVCKQIQFYRYWLKLCRNCSLLLSIWNILSILQTKFKFANGVCISKAKIAELNDVPMGPTYDRQYINKSFTVFFSERYMKKLIAAGLSRSNMLDKLRSSKRYSILADLYNARVDMDRRGDTAQRKSILKSNFRTKLNNWWYSNGYKLM